MVVVGIGEVQPTHQLLVARAFEIYERKDDEDRLRHKDPLEVLRIRRGTERDLERVRHLVAHEASGEVSRQGLSYLDELFRRWAFTGLEDGRACRRRAARPDRDPAVVRGADR